jgi:hypothetical protein
MECVSARIAARKTQAWTTMKSALIAIILTTLAGCSSESQRLIEVRVEQDGVFMLQTQFGVSEDATSTEIWNQLGQHRFKTRGVYAADTTKNQSLVLSGKVAITVRHAGEPLAAAEVRELRLTLVPGTTEYWMLPGEEVERTRMAAGL